MVESCEFQQIYTEDFLKIRWTVKEGPYFFYLPRIYVVELSEQGTFPASAVRNDRFVLPLQWYAYNSIDYIIYSKLKMFPVKIHLHCCNAAFPKVKPLPE